LGATLETGGSTPFAIIYATNSTAETITETHAAVSANARHRACIKLTICYTAVGIGEQTIGYCDEHACVCVCPSPRACLRNYTSNLHLIVMQVTMTVVRPFFWNQVA